MYDLYFLCAWSSYSGVFLELLEGDALLSIVGLLILFTSRVACHECPSVLGLPHAPRGPWNDGPEMYRVFPYSM